jgi:hypothetical protein
MSEQPQGVCCIDYDKLVHYYQQATKKAADALEALIDQASGVLPPEELSVPRSVLDSTREHLAGWHGPIRWVSGAEARRYVAEQNFHGNNGDSDFKPLRIHDELVVFVPK